MIDVFLPFHRAARASLMLALFADLDAQVNATRLPQFEDFPIREVFDQTPHAPILATPEQRLFRTRIREGVQKGWGVPVNGAWGTEQNKPGPNFAGHYIVIVWGCGSGCISMVMSDAKTGIVFGPPISEGAFALPMLVIPGSVSRAADLQFRKDSRLMIIRATPHEDRPGAVPCAFYFLWEGDRWRLMRQVRIDGPAEE
jgi:hypothetical protein